MSKFSKLDPRFTELPVTYQAFETALKVLNSMKFVEYQAEIVNAAYLSTEPVFDIELDGKHYDVKFAPKRENSSTGERSVTISVRQRNQNSLSKSSGTVSLYCDETRMWGCLLSYYSIGATTEHSMFFTSEHIITEDGSIVTYEHLEDCSFQYLTLSALPSLILKFVKG